jgi:hypothetical protein
MTMIYVYENGCYHQVNKESFQTVIKKPVMEFDPRLVRMPKILGFSCRRGFIVIHICRGFDEGVKGDVLQKRNSKRIFQRNVQMTK